MVITVTGCVQKEKLGVTLPHEHTLIDLRPLIEDAPYPEFKEKMTAEKRYLVSSDPYYLKDNAVYSDSGIALKELLLFRKEGGGAIADATLKEIGRDPIALKDLSERSGVKILMGCGHYVDAAHDPFVKENGVREIADEMIREITDGTEGTGVRAGFIGEIGTSAVITENEWKSAEAAFIAQKATGAAIHFHTALWEENGIQILERAVRRGVSPEKICIDHIDVVLRLDYCRKLLDLGAYIEFDNCGKEFFMPKRDSGLIRGKFAYDYERAEMIAALISMGYGDRILLSNDICLKSMFTHYGGNGFAHVMRTMIPMLRDVGVSESDIHRILCDNPQKFFDIENVC